MPEPALRPDGAAPDLVHVPAHHGQRQLVGQQFVEGQPRPRRRRRRQVALALGGVRLFERPPPGLPPLAGEECRIEPFVEVRRPLQRRADQLTEPFARQSGGQRIDRLHRQQTVPIAFVGDVIGVGHLQFLAVAFDDTADHPHRADRQHLLQVVGTGVKEHQHQVAGVVGASDLVGLAGAGVRRRLVDIDPDRERRHHSGAGIRDLGRIAAVDQPRRQVPQQMDHPRADQTFEQLSDTRPGAGEGAQRRKQRIEGFGTHWTTKWLTDGALAFIPRSRS